MSAVESQFVLSRLTTTNDLSTTDKPANNFRSRPSSNRFTWLRGGLTFPQARHVVRPSVVSCSKGTPRMISCFATSDDLLARLFDIRHVLQYFCAEDTV